MLKNYLKIALRRIQKQKLLSFINIGGLALGIACFLLISVYINHEMSYDNFHKNIKNIYRIYTIDNEPSGRKYSAMSPHPLPKALENDFPKLTNVVCINNPLEDEIKTDKNIYKEKIMFASPNFFNMFDFPYRAGTYKQLSKNINTIIITEDLSKKIFGNDISLGKTLTVHGKYDFIVGGVIKNIPSNSSFQFDAFISDEFLYRYIYPNEDKKWNSMGVETYVEFSPAISPQYLKSQFPIILNKYLPDYMKGRFGLDIQPLRDIHTNMDIESRITTQVSKLTLLIFFIIACTILAIASINFINLSTVLFIERQKEIGIRKVVGANRIQLIKQLLCESILITFFALLLGYILIQLILPYFNNYIQQPVSYNAINNISFILFAILFSLILGLINGIYPTLILSANKPLSLLKIEQQKLLGFIRLRYLPVTIQFGITIALIICVITVSKQISFMKNHDLGFLSNNLITIPVELKTMEDYRNVKLYVDLLNNEGLTHGIQSAAFSENVPGSFFPNDFKIIPEGVSNENGKEMVVTRSVSNDFLPTCKMKIIEGRNFSKNMSSDLNDAAIINQTAAKMLGWNNPVGKRIKFSFETDYYTIIGVIKDIHFRSLQNKIEPLVFTQSGGPINFVTLSINIDNYQAIIGYLKQQWTKIMPAAPFKYDFVDDMYRESYKKEEKLLNAISSFTTLAIILASLGLFGLTALIAMKRTKEIGIRKTLGANVIDIILLMSKELIFWVIMANILAVPVALYFTNRWLQNFPYRIELNWWIVTLSGLIALIIAIAVSSIHSIKAATSNPVEALRYE